MAKAPTSDSIMAADRMKPLLALSKRDPVQAAIAVTTDGEGVILLDKKAKPKKVAALLRAAAAKAKLQLNPASIRFGRAEVDTDYDSGMVRFFINKDAPGNMRIKLVEVVKRCAYQKVELNVDPTLEEDTDEDEAEATSDTPAGEPPQPVARPTDPAALAAELAALMRRIPEVTDAAAKAPLLKFATEANAAIKSGSLDAATLAIAELRAGLRDALDAAGAGTAQVTPNGRDTSPPANTPLAAELGTLARRIAEAAGADAGLRGALAKRAGDIQAALKSGDLAAAAAGIAELRAAIDQATTRGAALGPALASWSAARTQAISALNAVVAEVSKMDFVDAPAAIILLRAIAANLTEAPATRAQVDELRRYLNEDENVAEAEEPNGFGIELALRAPLLAALDGVAAGLPA